MTLVPGEVYPYSVHVISSRAHRDSAVQGGAAGYLESMEPCCGTHLLNTAHIGTFVIESVVRNLLFWIVLLSFCSGNGISVALFHFHLFIYLFLLLP